MVTNKNNKIIFTRIVIGWRIYIDYRKLNKATMMDHFPLHFIYQMLDRLEEVSYYYFLYGYSSFNEIIITSKDQDKTTFTCLYGTFVFR